MTSAISVSQLTKIYRLPKKGLKTAVEGLTFTVEKGEIFGFLGPNGAGKTTTIKTILGFIRPTFGSAEILGISAEKPEARAQIGYLPEQPYFHKFMTPTEIVLMHAGLAGIARRERKSTVEQVLQLVGLVEQAKTPVSKLSKGQVQRVGLAQALVGDPKILILDEPASGLDPLGRRQVRDMLVSQRDQGRTIFLSSHLLSEIETICDRVAVLSHGKLTAIGSPEEIKRGEDRVSVTTGAISTDLLERIEQLGASVQLSGQNSVIGIDSARLYELIDILRDAELALYSVAPDKESLEEAFLRLAA